MLISSYTYYVCSRWIIYLSLVTHYHLRPKSNPGRDQCSQEQCNCLSVYCQRRLQTAVGTCRKDSKEDTEKLFTTFLFRCITEWNFNVGEIPLVQLCVDPRALSYALKKKTIDRWIQAISRSLKCLSKMLKMVSCKFKTLDRSTTLKWSREVGGRSQSILPRNYKEAYFQQWNYLGWWWWQNFKWSF